MSLPINYVKSPGTHIMMPVGTKRKNIYFLLFFSVYLETVITDAEE